MESNLDSMYTKANLSEIPSTVSMFPPHIMDNGMSRYAVLLGTRPGWYRVSDDVNMCDLIPLWQRERSYIERAPLHIRSWNVEGSKGDMYVVQRHDGILKCSCSGYSFRRRCRHVDQVISDLKKSYSGM